jgi:hypothetical protein
LGLFEAVTYPSVRAQTSQEFHWLIVVDRQIPEESLRRLRQIVADAPNAYLVPFDLTNIQRVRHGSFDHVWERCQDYIVERGLLTDPSEYVLTSQIDADDALRRGAIELAQEICAPELEQLASDEPYRSAIVRHCCGYVLTFPLGIRWFLEADIVQPFTHPFLGMGVFILTRFSSGISVMSCRHSAWPEMAYTLMFEVKEAALSTPMWVYVRHERAQVPWQIETRHNHAASVHALQNDFGIDSAKVAIWRANDALRRAQSPQDFHPGLSSGEQHDCYFRICALNRQIAVLERKEQEIGLNKADEMLMLQQRRERLSLVRRLQQQGRGFN